MNIHSSQGKPILTNIGMFDTSISSKDTSSRRKRVGSPKMRISFLPRASQRHRFDVL